MKLSEKYFYAYIDKCSDNIQLKVHIKIYAEIIALESQQTLLVSNPYTFPQEKHIDKLAEIVNQLENLKIKHQL